MKITDAHGEHWVVRCRGRPWDLRLIGWTGLRELWSPSLSELADLVLRPVLSVPFILPSLLEVAAAAVALPFVLLLRAVGVITTTVEVRDHGSNPRRWRRSESWCEWTVPVRGLLRARRVRAELAEFVRQHGNDGELHRRLARGYSVSDLA